MIRHVRIVGILMILQGIITLLVGLGWVALGIAGIMFGLRGPNGLSPKVIGATYLAIGCLNLLLGSLQIHAGNNTLRFQNRIFSIVMLFANMGLVFSIYSFPTGFILLIYGLIVLFNHDVARAFEMVRNGATVEEAKAGYEGQYNDIQDDYDDINAE